MTALRAWTILATIAVAITLPAVAFVGDFLHETLGLPWRSIGGFVMLLVTAAGIGVLWRAMLRELARRPDGSDSRKDKKLGS